MSTTCVICKHPAEFYTSAMDVEYFTIDKPIQYNQCTNPQCGVLLADPMMADKLDIIYPHNYYSFATSSNSFVHKIKNWIDLHFYKNILQSLDGENLKVLDIGGGSGYVSGLIKNSDQRISHTMIVDIDRAAEKKARNAGHDFFCGRLEEFNSGKFYDLILMLNVIEHVTDPASMLQNVRELLSDQGVIIVQTPNIDSWDAKIFKNKSWGGYHSPRHFVLFNKENFVSMALRLKLKIFKFKYVQGASFWALSIMNILHKKRWIRASKERPLIDHPLSPLLLAIFAGFDIIRGRIFKTSQMIVLLKK